MATITTSPANVHPTAIATVWLSLCGFVGVFVVGWKAEAGASVETQ